MDADLFDVTCGRPNLGRFTGNFWGYMLALCVGVRVHH